MKRLRRRTFQKPLATVRWTARIGREQFCGSLTPLFYGPGNDIVAQACPLTEVGSPAEENENRLVYHLHKEDVLIVLSGSKFCNYKNSAIPPGTVLMIQVTPREKFVFKEIRNEGKNWRTFEPSSQDSNWLGYIDDEEGLLGRTFQDSVDRIFYIPTAKERAACPPYYDRPEEMAQIILVFHQGHLIGIQISHLRMRRRVLITSQFISRISRRGKLISSYTPGAKKKIRVLELPAQSNT